MNFFGDRAKNADGIPSMLRGTLPLLRAQVRKIQPDTAQALAQFLGGAFDRIADGECNRDDFEQWLSELTQANE